jgi:N-carbamoylputrescine amidase
MLLRIAPQLPSLTPSGTSSAATLRVAALQQRWHVNAAEHMDTLAEGIRLAATNGAVLVCLPELTLSPYFCSVAPGADTAVRGEDLPTGPTLAFVRAMASECGVAIQASLFEDVPGTKGYNTAFVVGPNGALLGVTRKLHLPVTEGYYEDQYFDVGPASAQATPTYDVGGATFAVATCWDQWFPELARLYGLQGTQVLAYPTAIGSEPGFPDFDSAPVWRHTMVAHGIANGLFIVAPNRYGTEGAITFYGSSFISDPFGRVLVEAPRDEAAVLVATLPLGQCEDWLSAFPFFAARRPDVYGAITAPLA